MIFKMVVLKILQYSQYNSGINKVVGLQTCNFIKKRLPYRRFPANITFLRTPTFIEQLRWLLRPCPRCICISVLHKPTFIILKIKIFHHFPNTLIAKSALSFVNFFTLQIFCFLLLHTILFLVFVFLDPRLSALILGSRPPSRRSSAPKILHD